MIQAKTTFSLIFVAFALAAVSASASASAGSSPAAKFYWPNFPLAPVDEFDCFMCQLTLKVVEAFLEEEPETPLDDVFQLYCYNFPFSQEEMCLAYVTYYRDIYYEIASRYPFDPLGECKKLTSCPQDAVEIDFKKSFINKMIKTLDTTRANFAKKISVIYI